MKNLKNPVFIIGAIAFLVVVGLTWNYTEAIKAKNEIEKERILSEERLKQAQIEQDQRETEVNIQADKEAQGRQIESDRIAAE